MATATKAKKREGGYHEAVGRRKESVARVRLTPAKKTEYSVNEKEMHVYFPTEELRRVVKHATEIVPDTHYTVEIKVKGGGIHSQAEAVSLGIARALEKIDNTVRPLLKKEGLLSRNARIKERRKFGLKKARKAPQWSKR